MLEDALLMIGIYVLKDQKLLALANKYFSDPHKDFIELYRDIKPEQIQELYNQARLIEDKHKIMLSVFQGSTIRNQLPILKNYQNDIEVCQSIYAREYSVWSKQYETVGELV